MENTTARYQQTGEDIAALAEDLKRGLMRLEEMELARGIWNKLRKRG